MFARRVLGRLSSITSQNPVKTAAVVGAFCGTAGDLVCQTVVEDKGFSQIDFRRTFAFFSFGLLYSGPVNLKLYQLYARHLTPLFRSTFSLAGWSTPFFCFAFKRCW